MTRFLLALLILVPLLATAQQRPRGGYYEGQDQNYDREGGGMQYDYEERRRLYEERQRQMMQQQMDRQREMESARVRQLQDRCRNNRGADCDSAQGLQEWDLLDRSRREAIQDGSRRVR